MKRHFTFLTVVLSFFVLFSGISLSEAASLKSSIIGKWFQSGGSIEFLKDGTVIVVERGDSLAGNYKFIDNNRIKVELGPRAMAFEVSIREEGQLILTDPAGKVDIYFTKAEWEKIVAAERAERKRREAEARAEAERKRVEKERREAAEKAEAERKRAEKRAEWEKWVKERFTISDLTVLHKEKNLMWTRDANIAGKMMNWNDAVKFIESLNGQNYAGYSNWRFPSKEELLSLVNFAKGQGRTDLIYEFLKKFGFKNVSGYYWSSSTYARDTDYAWYVSMWNGAVDAVSKANDFDVWPVRSGQ